MAPASGADRLQLCSDVVINDIEDGLLVVNLDNGKTWKLNRVGAAVCHGIEQGGDLDSIVAQVANQYGAELTTVRRDIDALIADLRKEGLVEPRAGDSP
jgi:hypothetical protein